MGVSRPVARFLVSLAVCGALALLSQLPDGRTSNARAATNLDGSSAACDAVGVSLVDFFLSPLLSGVIDLAGIQEPGWVWVKDDPAQHIKSMTGTVTDAFPTHSDFPAVHDTHDVDMHILPDAGYEGLVSNAAAPGTPGELNQGEMEVEWEFGTFPSETSGDPPERTFPRWAWPSTGDRVFVSGQWVFDCGHPDANDRFFSELHPLRAIASMRDQVHTMPGTGSTPVRVTATDLYIHGRSGFVMDDLTCGLGIIFGDGSCSPSPYPHRGTPIDDNYDFDMCLPPTPSANAILVTSMENGPGNTIGVNPILTPQTAAGPCADAKYGSTQIHVHVPLAGTGVTPDDVLARKILAGWAFPANGLKHITAKLKLGVLHDDQDPGGDCECSFFWVNVDKSPDEWFRLTPYEIPTDDQAGSLCTSHTNTLNDWDDDSLCGNGHLNFNGPNFDFYVAGGQDYKFRTQAYDQDCLDGRYGDFQITSSGLGGAIAPTLDGLALAACYLTNNGDNDIYDVATATNLGAGNGQSLAPSSNQFQLFFDVTSDPVNDSADLSLTKQCPTQPLSGQPFTCTITVTNPGPGLPRDAVVNDTLTTPNIAAAHYSIGTPTFAITYDGSAPVTGDCSVPNGGSFQCNLGTVPVGGTAVVSVQVTTDRGGTFFNDASVTSPSDPNTNDNHAQVRVDVVQVVPIDIKPGDATNPVKVSLTGSSGTIPVAILSTPDFNAPARVDRTSLTFGRTGNEASLVSCSKNGEDINRDGRLDLKCSFKNDPRLFQAGDTTGILRGRTVDSPAILIQGIDRVTPVP